MKSLTDHLTAYAAYHRDERNIATHMVGVPLIVLAIATLLSRPVLWEGPFLPLTPAFVVAAAILLFYCLLNAGLAIVMGLALALALAGASWIARQETVWWLSAGIGTFVVGWAIQFVGHLYEGRKPAFMDDVRSLLIGPLFVMVEWLNKLGLYRGVFQEMERRAGPAKFDSCGVA
ncbi:Mpo1-like protein [Hydrogenophaga sp. 5NK40-0174]|uniref:Mpo1 family 2-hydroxy fatty acid dioxygenase n=1 Tax=Hydrogenophaga sp. 5NK40-0174 TaxID=3127649 RepID=UPI003102EBDD